MELFDNLAEAFHVCQIAWTVVILKIRVAEPFIYDDELVLGDLFDGGSVRFGICAVLKGNFRGY
jgi:hypothetical protein